MNSNLILCLYETLCNIWFVYNRCANLGCWSFAFNHFLHLENRKSGLSCSRRMCKREELSTVDTHIENEHVPDDCAKSEGRN